MKFRCVKDDSAQECVVYEDGTREAHSVAKHGPWEHKREGVLDTVEEAPADDQSEPPHGEQPEDTPAGATKDDPDGPPADEKPVENPADSNGADDEPQVVVLGTIDGVEYAAARDDGGPWAFGAKATGDAGYSRVGEDELPQPVRNEAVAKGMLDEPSGE